MLPTFPLCNKTCVLEVSTYYSMIIDYRFLFQELVTLSAFLQYCEKMLDSIKESSDTKFELFTKSYAISIVRHKTPCCCNMKVFPVNFYAKMAFHHYKKGDASKNQVQK